jgi:phosphate transport system ATP-binding protein
MIYARPNLFPMSIYDNVAYGVKLIGWDPKVELDQIVELAVKSADVWEEVKNNLYKSALELSYGQQHRLCIARALAVKPQVLLMEDLCSGLDPVTTMKTEELIECLRYELTIVFISYKVQQVSRLSDSTALFHYNENRIGQILEFAPTKKFLPHTFNYRSRDYISGSFR